MRRIAAFLVLLACSRSVSARPPLTFEDRVAAQRAVEEVFWRHRIWPDANQQRKPPLSAVLPDEAIRAKVTAYLQASRALEVSGSPVTAVELQAELDRMAATSRAPDVLMELFEALANDPYVIAEVLARPIVVARQHRDDAGDSAGDSSLSIPDPTAIYTLPRASVSTCTPDAWTSFGSPEPPGDPDGATAVWTGTELIVWGGNYFNAGGRYNPATDSWAPTSEGAGCPAGRSSHTAVWTGTRMIVWGGMHWQSGNKSTGGIYDPATDSWTATSTGANTPAPRSGHVAVWTGSRMIVWGGSNPGGRFDPVSNTWSAVSTVGAPSARSGTAAVWTGSQMIVWGGGGASQVQFADGGRYDPVADQWFPMNVGGWPPPPAARAGHSAVWTGSLMIVWGGAYSNGYYKYQDGGFYDPVSDQWGGLGVGANAPEARAGHAAVWTGSKMVIWGGGGGNDGHHLYPLSSGGAYDVATGTWQSMPAGELPSAWAPDAVWTGSEVLVWGGTLGRYDASANVWKPHGPGVLPQSATLSKAVWTGAEMIVWGGSTAGLDYSSNGAAYTPATNSWRLLSWLNEPYGRNGHTATWTGTKMVVWGGQWAPSNAESPFPIASGGRYDPAADAWQATNETAAPAARMNHSAVWTGSRMLVWGGEGQFFGPWYDTGGSYDPVGDTWTALSTSGAPSARSSHAAVWTGRELLVWGGSVGYGVTTNTGGRYDPVANQWSAFALGGAPAARSAANAVWTGREMVVWGGGLATGGRYSPSTDAWTPTSTGDGCPAPRSGSTAVWTGREMIVWGGAQGSSFLGTGGRYDLVTDSWTATSMTGAPRARAGHVAAWTGSEMLVWGGEFEGGWLDDGARQCVSSCAAPATWHQDADGDGYGSASVTFASCEQPYAFVADATDCDDWNASRSPGNPEICGDLVDNDCNGAVDDAPPVTWYRDADGDGFGNALNSLPSCARLAGYVLNATDCNDASASIHPGAPEICADATDNDCDGTIDNSEIPSARPVLTMSKAGGSTQLSWSQDPTAIFHDVVKGYMIALVVSGGDFRYSLAGCLGNDSYGSSVADSAAPSNGNGFWYLVRGASCGGAGSYDEGVPGQVGSRDAEIAAAAGACP